MSIFNQPISETIKNTLVRKQNLMGKESRSTQELAFLNSNTSWVSLKSSVNVGNDDGALAKNNVLQGGLESAGKFKSGITADSSGAYSLANSDGTSNILGIRPMPGITSISVDNIGAYGSLRKATINFQCWDIKQLEILEKLYMRPGYTLLLEFGRITYIDKDGKLVKVSSNQDFFSGKGIDNMQSYLNELHRKSIKSEGNYDAFFGYITNYGWNARPDGGYDCKTELISTGELLESLKVNYSFAGAVDFSTLQNGEEIITAEQASAAKFKGIIFPQFNTRQYKLDIKQLNVEYSKNILSGLAYELYTILRYAETPSEATSFPGVSAEKKLRIKRIKGEPIDVNFAEITYGPTVNPTDAKDLFVVDNKNYYITLKSFCDIFTEFVLLKSYDNDKSGKSTKSKGDLLALSTNDRTYHKEKDDNADPLLCLFNQLMLSTNPDVCWIRNDDWIDVLKGTVIETNLQSVKVSEFQDSDVNSTASNEVKRKIVGWIKKLLTPQKDTVLTSIADTIKNSGLSETEYIKLINKNFTYIRGGKSATNNKQYRWDAFLSFGGTGTEVAELRSKYNNIETLGQFISQFVAPDSTTNLNVTQFGTFSNTTQSDKDQLVNKLRVKYPNVEQLVQQTQNNIDEAAKIAEEDQKNKTELNTISDNYKNINDSINQSFIYAKGGTASRFGQIGNIYINLKHIYSLSKDTNLISQDQSGNGKLSASSFIKKLLQDIQVSLCNVNQFELHIDPTDGVGRIIDLNYINKDKVTGEDMFKFEIGSNKSIVRNLKLESQIFSDQSSIVAISAQQDGNKLGLNNSTLVGFNEGITDRMIPKKDSYLNNLEAQEVTIVQNYVSSLSFIVNEYLKNFVGKATKIQLEQNTIGDGTVISGPSIGNYQEVLQDANFNSGASLSYSNSLKDIIFFFTSLSSFNTDNKGKAFIPTLLSMTIDGLSGFIIGNLFKVDNTFVPNYYKKGEKLAYILTKINHEISGNDWTTTISGYPFNLESNSTEVKNISDFKVIVSIDPNPTGTSGVGNGTDVSLGRKTFIDSLTNIRKIYPGVKYTVTSPNPNKYIFNPTFNNAMESIFDTLAKNNLTKYESLTVTSGIRNTEQIKVDQQTGKISSKHPYGKALDFQITENKGQKAIVSANYPKFKINGFLDKEPTQKTRVDNIVKVIVDEFGGKLMENHKHWYYLKVGGVGIKFLNEIYEPSNGATGPHFHFELI